MIIRQLDAAGRLGSGADLRVTTPQVRLRPALVGKPAGSSLRTL